MHWDAIISTIVAGGAAALGFSGLAGAAGDVAVLVAMIFAVVAGYDAIYAYLHRKMHRADFRYARGFKKYRHFGPNRT